MPRRGENIRKRNDGRWEGRYLHKEADGTYKYKSIYGKTYREVKERMNVILFRTNTIGELSTKSEQAQVPEYNKSNAYFNEIAKKWLSHIEETRKYSTYIKYLKLYEHYIKDALQKAAVSDISNDLIAERIFDSENKQDISANMKHSILAIINQILKYANEYCRCPAMKLSNRYPKDRNNHIEIINHSDQAALLRYL